MGRVEKSVFLSYRRDDIAWALAVYQSLTSHGYDVFFDFNGIDSGDFERVILANVQARAHFVLILTPLALKRCSGSKDWLRREIEAALRARRNIVVLMLAGFEFHTAEAPTEFIETFKALRKYNALVVHADYFEEAMGRLRTRYLNVTLDAVLHSVTDSAQQATKAQQISANGAPLVTPEVLARKEKFKLRLSINRALDENVKLFCLITGMRKADFVANAVREYLLKHGVADPDADHRSTVDKLLKK